MIRMIAWPNQLSQTRCTYLFAGIAWTKTIALVVVSAWTHFVVTFNSSNGAFNNITICS